MSSFIGHRPECRWCREYDLSRDSRCRCWPEDNNSPWLGDQGICGHFVFNDCQAASKSIVEFAAAIRDEDI